MFKLDQQDILDSNLCSAILVEMYQSTQLHLRIVILPIDHAHL